MRHIKNLKLKPEIKALWLEALRGDKYEQGQAALRCNGADGTTDHCCLGVLTDLCPLDKFTTQTGSELNKEQLLDGFSYLATEVADWAFEGFVPKEDEEGQHYDVTVNDTKLTKMNDSGNHGFWSIANTIEEVL